MYIIENWETTESGKKNIAQYHHIEIFLQKKGVLLVSLEILVKMDILDKYNNKMCLKTMAIILPTYNVFSWKATFCILVSF